MNRGHGVAHRGAQNAQNVQKWQKLGNYALGVSGTLNQASGANNQALDANN